MIWKDFIFLYPRKNKTSNQYLKEKHRQKVTIKQTKISLSFTPIRSSIYQSTSNSFFLFYSPSRSSIYQSSSNTFFSFNSPSHSRRRGVPGCCMNDLVETQTHSPVRLPLRWQGAYLWKRKKILELALDWMKENVRYPFSLLLLLLL